MELESDSVRLEKVQNRESITIGTNPCDRSGPVRRTTTFVNEPQRRDDGVTIVEEISLKVLVTEE